MLQIKNRWFLLDCAEKHGIPKIYDLLNKLQVCEDAIAKTDGTIIYINPDEFNKLAAENQFFILCHELLHIIYKHCDKERNKKYKIHKLLNMAQDIVINEYLSKRLKFKEPNGLYLSTIEEYLHDNGILPKSSSLVYTGRLTTHDLYRFLYSLIPFHKLDDFLNQFPGIGSDLMEPQDSTLEDEKIPLDVFEQACDSLKITQEGLSRELGISVAETKMPYTEQDSYNSKVLSTDEIIDFCKQFVGNNAVVRARAQTFSRPNRRIHSNDFIMKGYKYRKNVQEIVIYLDTSGSMDDFFIRDMYKTLQTLFQTTKFKLFEFTWQVREVNLKEDYLYASGGTNITNVLNHIKRNKFDHAIMITDCQDKFSLNDIDSDLMIFTNDLNFTTKNPKVKLNYFSYYV